MAEKGRPRGFDRDAALETAMRLFWRKGFTATSMTDLTTAMGISAPSLYAAFGNKDALYREALNRFIDTEGRAIWSEIATAPTARAAVASVLAASADHLPGGYGSAGCMVTLSGAVQEECSPEIRDTLLAARSAGMAMLLDRLTQAVTAGEIAPSHDLPRLARFVLCVQQGMSIQARDGATAQALHDIAKDAMTAWDALMRDPAVSCAPSAA